MNVRNTIVILLIVFNVSIAGCIEGEPGTEISYKFNGELKPSSEGFEMDGHIETSGGFPPKETYQNLTVCLYTKDGHIMHSEQFGDMNAYGQLNISITYPNTPHYILIDSADTSNPKIGTSYFELIKPENYYQTHVIGSPAESPVKGCV